MNNGMPSYYPPGVAQDWSYEPKDLLLHLCAVIVQNGDLFAEFLRVRPIDDPDELRKLYVLGEALWIAKEIQCRACSFINDPEKGEAIKFHLIGFAGTFAYPVKIVLEHLAWTIEDYADRLRELLLATELDVHRAEFAEMLMMIEEIVFRGSGGDFTVLMSLRKGELSPLETLALKTMAFLYRDAAASLVSKSLG